MAPKYSRLAVLLNPASPMEPLALREFQSAATTVGVEVQSIDVRTPDDYPVAFATVTANHADALHTFANPVNYRSRQLIADLALRSRLPSSHEERIFVEAGRLLSYAPSYVGMCRRAAMYVDKILKGANPGELPIEQTTRFELVINAKAARALGLPIPQSLLLRADELDPVSTPGVEFGVPFSELCLPHHGRCLCIAQDQVRQRCRIDNSCRRIKNPSAAIQLRIAPVKLDFCRQKSKSHAVCLQDKRGNI